MGRNGTIRLLGNTAVKRQKSALSYPTNLPRMMPHRWSGIGLQAASIKAKPKLHVFECLLQEAGGGEQLLLLQRWGDVCDVQRPGV
jgi:hypothetical protein